MPFSWPRSDLEEPLQSVCGASSRKGEDVNIEPLSLLQVVELVDLPMKLVDFGNLPGEHAPNETECLEQSPNEIVCLKFGLESDSASTKSMMSFFMAWLKPIIRPSSQAANFEDVNFLNVCNCKTPNLLAILRNRALLAVHTHMAAHRPLQLLR
eukprot:CAMPEP_0172716848 /NCGR_PEP_ID=MMETSP1074-20121228/69572_1 /TAXON_ID=2916 /ORGANISM="Ceratium fusus, Strain PA161109" /LENGTH=153 /DNA_ID=CAMNT_0013541645 /DNA_START=723 /DNA_END=1179 /DNA_ORIENTATION=+